MEFLADERNKTILPGRIMKNGEESKFSRRTKEEIVYYSLQFTQMIKYEVSNEFSGLKDFTVNLPETFDKIGSVILDYRNVIKKITTPRGTLVVKDFKGMYFFNRLGYSLFSMSKSERSFVNSARLNEKGFKTPQHVGWVDVYNGGLLMRSFFVSVFDPYDTVRELLIRNKNDRAFKESFYGDLIKFIASLHNAGVYHDDFSLANMLAIPTPEGYEFSLVDLNRIRFMKISFRQGLRNFNKFDMAPDDLNELIRVYAIAFGEEADQALKLFWADKKSISRLRGYRKALRKYTLTPVEKLFKEEIPKFFQERCNA